MKTFTIFFVLIFISISSYCQQNKIEGIYEVVNSTLLSENNKAQFDRALFVIALENNDTGIVTINQNSELLLEEESVSVKCFFKSKNGEYEIYSIENKVLIGTIIDAKLEIFDFVNFRNSRFVATKL